MATSERRRLQAVTATRVYRVRHPELVRLARERYRQSAKGIAVEQAYRKKTAVKHREYVNRYCQKHPERRLAYHLRETYGITLAEYKRLLQEQANLCASCGQPETRKHPRSGKLQRLSVDHSHTTNQVRGLLCHRCNRVLGLIGEDVAVLRGMEAYLCRKSA